MTNVTYLHGDHLGSITAATNGSGVVLSRQEYTPWGDRRGTQEITETALDFTGQRRDDTGLLFYNARYYDPALGRFISGDSIVPGASGGVIGLSNGKLTPLTVDFREPGFASTAGDENRLVLGKGFLDEETVHTGSSNPQALNRYSYVINNPLRYVDPTGHWIESALDVAAIAYDIYKIHKEGMTWENALALAADIIGLGLPVATGLGMIVRAGGKGASIYEVALKADNPRLQRAIDQLFKRSDGEPGGTAGAIREELRTGKPVGGRFHSIKGQQRVSQLGKILKQESLSPTDRSIAEALLKDLQDALAGR